MKIIFFANSKFSIPSLESLLKSNNNILSVITNTDKKGGRGNKIISTPVADFSIKNNLDLFKIDNINNESFINKLKLLCADIYIVISYKIIPKTIFSIPKYGTINIHASLLPEYKGAAPIQRSIINNEKTLGLTSFIINSQIDSGKIINQKKIIIDDKITYGEAYDILSIKAGNFLINTLDLIKNNNSFNFNIKNSSYAKKIINDELKISLYNSSKKIHNLFRGLTPPGPYLIFNNKRIKLFNTYYLGINEYNLSIGAWKIADHLLYIGCKSGTLLTDTIQYEAKNKISIIDFNNMKHSLSIRFK